MEKMRREGCTSNASKGKNKTTLVMKFLEAEFV